MIFSIKKMLGLTALLGMGLLVSQTQAATCSYKVESEWSTGFTASITILNNGGSAINGWNVGWRFNTNRMTSGWNATFSGANPYAAKDAGWNGSIQPGQSVNFGFQADKNGGGVERPAVTGAVCGGTVPTSVAPSSTGNSVWTNCSNENQICSFSGTKRVRYGAGTSWREKISTGSIACNNATFGDPIPGTFKTCQTANYSGPNPSSKKSSSVSSTINNGGGFVSKHGRLRTNNGRLVDQGGGPLQLRGMSTHGLQWFGQYANVSTVKWLRDDWKANVIRAAMYVKEGGYLDNASVINKVWETIDAAIAADIYVIVDWHILSDGNPLTNKEAAKDFFRKVTAKYGNNPHIIYEIANEPNGGDVNWGNAIKPYANEVIPVIRQGAPDAFVIVGTAVWSQRLDQVVASPLAFDKVAYSIHFYSCSAEHQDPLRAIVKAAADAKLPIFSTEWGNSEYTGAGAICPGQTDTWLNLLDQYGISWVNWSLSDKGETSAALRSGASTNGGWSTSQLTESGNYVRNRMRGY